MKTQPFQIESKGFTIKIHQKLLSGQIIIRKIVVSDFEEMNEFYNLARILFEESDLEKSLEDWFLNGKYIFLEEKYKVFFDQESYLDGALEVVKDYFDYYPNEFTITDVYVYHLYEDIFANLLSDYYICKD